MITGIDTFTKNNLVTAIDDAYSVGKTVILKAREMTIILHVI